MTPPLVPDRAWHFEREYGSVDYHGAVVLDVGADYGCSPEFFLGRGASRVIACEADPECRRRLTEWAAGKPVTVLPGGLRPGMAAEVLTEYRPEVVKVDCEGCEALLLDVPDELLGEPRAWVLETHSIALYRDLRARFEGLGYAVTMICDFGDVPNRSGKVCKVWKAERQPEGEVT